MTFVLDIETDESGFPTDYGFYDGNSFYHFTETEVAVTFMCENPGTFYAHCGMRFDYCIIYSELLKRVDYLNIVCSGTIGVYIHGKVQQKDLILLDSYRLMPAPLAALSKSFGKTRKLEISVMPWELTQEQRLEYLRLDCVALYEVLQEFWRIIDDNFLPESGKKIRANTLASLSLKIFLKKFLCVPGDKLMVSTGRLAKFESNSYFGGLVYVNPEVLFHDKLKVSVFDVNSMYPFVMSNFKFPYSYVGYWTDKFEPKSVGLWECDFWYPGVPFIFDVPSRKLTNMGYGIIDTDSILYIKSKGGIVDVKVGYVYQKVDYIFKEFVQTLYGLRMRFGSSSPMGYTCKILMNSLYGKFGEKSLKRVLTTQQPDDVIDGKCKIYDGGFMEVFDYFEDRLIRHRFCVLSSLVTLRARLYIRQLADKVGSVFYIDTDSLHVPVGLGEQVLDVGSELGMVKLEYTNVEAKYLGKKMYQLYGDDGQVIKSVNKGIPKAAMVYDFRNVESGKCEYQTFTTLFEVISDPVRPFHAKKATRTFRNTVKND